MRAKCSIAVIAVALIPAGFARAESVDVGAIVGPTISFTYVEDGHTRTVTRGLVRGRDDARVAGVFVDDATGRTAPVTVGASVIVRVPQSARAFVASLPFQTRDIDLGDDDARHDNGAPFGLTGVDVHVREVLFPSAGLVSVASTRVDREDALELAQRLARDDDGDDSDDSMSAVPNLGFRQRVLSDDSIHVPPNDPSYSGQFYLNEVKIEDAWKISTGSNDVTVLVADNGCDMQHPDLVGKMDQGYDPFENDDDPSYVSNVDGNNPDNEHGTACAGLIAASTDNDIDIAGTCPLCRLRCARLLPSATESGSVDSDVLSYGFAFDVNVDVVSNSWGFVDAIPVPGPLHDAIVEVQQHGRSGKGAVVVFASGNDARVVGDDELLAVPGVVGVGAVNNLGELTQFSNGGNSLDVVAPTGTLATDISGPDGLDPGDVTTAFGGTSSACPIVSGIVGLIIAAHPDKTADEIDDALNATAKQSVFATPDQSGHDTYYGFGLVQPAKALAFFDATGKPKPKTTTTGCGCTSSASPADLAWCPALIALAHVRRRRR